MPETIVPVETKAMVSRVRETGWREATGLENDAMRVLVDDIGGFTPELCSISDKRLINAHWIPHFRASSSKKYDDSEHGAYWKSEHLFHLAGSFPCAPNYGSGHILDGTILPVNGYTANKRWIFEQSGKDTESGAVWASFTMPAADAKFPVSYKKIDALIPGDSVHYAALKITNTGSKDMEICAAWQNMIGAPFLSPGCRISASAREWSVSPPVGEFTRSTRLAPGKEFISLSKAPLGTGGNTDISVVPGPIGFTDFVTGAIPKSSPLGWSAVLNPVLKMAYIMFFPGPSTADKGEFPIYFNNFLMQYGGRPWTPWALYEGGTDLCYCLGGAQSTAAWTLGLEASRMEKKLMGSPTTVTIPGRSSRTLYYGTLFASYEDNILDAGIVGIEAEEKHLICKSSAESWPYKADTTFKVLRRLCL